MLGRRPFSGRCFSAVWRPDGCGSTEPGTSSPSSAPSQPSRPRIALVMKSLANEFFKTMAEGAKKHQASTAREYELIVNGIKDERDLARQVALVDEMIAQRVDAIVIAPADSKALVSACKRAQEAGIAVVNIDNKLDSQVLAEQGDQGSVRRAGQPRRGEDGRRLTWPKQAQAGRPGGDAGGDQDRVQRPAAEARLRGRHAKDAGLKIVDSQSAQWEIEPANKIASAMIGEHPEIKALLCCNDSMALGALAAVKAAGRAGQVLIVGYDGISAVADGDQGRRDPGDGRPARRPARGLRHRVRPQARSGGRHRRPTRRRRSS